MPEQRVSGRTRRSVGFPALTLMLLGTTVTAVAWAIYEFFGLDSRF